MAGVPGSLVGERFDDPEEQVAMAPKAGATLLRHDCTVGRPA